MTLISQKCFKNDAVCRYVNMCNCIKSKWSIAWPFLFAQSWRSCNTLELKIVEKLKFLLSLVKLCRSFPKWG